MDDAQPAPRRFPPFEETLQRVQVPEIERDMPLDGTFGYAATRAAITLELADPVGFGHHLPGLSIDFGAKRGGALSGDEGSTPPDVQVLGLLGSGGMGQVHLAEQRSLGREVAIKTVHPGSETSAEVALCEEALITGQVEHPSVIPVHALGRSIDGRPVMVMKRVEGVSWKTLLQDPSHPLWEAIPGGRGLAAHLQILVQVGHAVAFAHSRGIVHRDLKPENVMIGRFGEVYVVDWGLAVRSNTERYSDGAHRVVGTPAYMAPEMVAGFEIDERTDVYLLGAILYELLAGRPPHEGETLVMVLSAAYISAPKEFGRDVPEELAALCRAALARDPADRPATAGAFRDALVGYLEHRSSIALARSAHAGLRALEGRDRARPEDRQEIRRVLTECRFGFLQALSEWPENRAAREGLERALAEVVRLEVAEGHAGAARLALEELGASSPELEAEVAALEARLAEVEAAAEKLRQLTRDLDASVGADARKRAAWIIVGLGSIISAMVVRRVETGVMTPVDLVRVAGFMVVFMGGLLVGFRRRLFRNAFSRKVAVLSLVASAAMFVHRALAAWAGQPIHVILATDSLIFSIMMVVTAITLAGFMGYGALFTLAGAIMSLAAPRWAPLSFSVSTLSMLAAAALLFRPEASRERQPEDVSGPPRERS